MLAQHRRSHIVALDSPNYPYGTTNAFTFPYS